MQQGDYSSSSYYHHQQQYPNLSNPNPIPIPNPNPPPVDPHPSTAYASAPPFSAGSDFPSYYPSYPHNPDPTPPYDLHVPYQPPTPPPVTAPQSYYPPFDQHQTPSNYGPPPANPTPPSNPPPYYSSSYGGNIASSASVPPVYDNLYNNANPPNFDNTGGVIVGAGGGGGSASSYFDDKYGGGSVGYSTTTRSDSFGKGSYGYGGGRDDVYGETDGVYAYEGGRVEPYGARGTAPKSSTWTQFDDYGRPIGSSHGKESSGRSGSGSGSSLGKVVRAVPKADAQQDVKSGVQKFRVKVLAESGGQSTMDVLCQIGLDGLHMLDPATSRTLRIYPLENITRCDKMDSSTFAFWSKSSVDIEPRRIRLQSNSYTTNSLLDTVTAAIVQLKEMGGRSKPSDSIKPAEQTAERKRFDWINLMKTVNEEKDHWVPDEAANKCTSCRTDFSAFVRRHHCRNCGDIFCDKCTQGRTPLTSEENAPQVRVCDRCLAEVTHRLSNAKEAANKQSAGFHSHEDLAKKLQEELERNRKSSSGSKSDGSGKKMKEVACPICTVHLQVQVPSSGSETIECGVCQHPFLVMNEGLSPCVDGKCKEADMIDHNGGIFSLIDPLDRRTFLDTSLLADCYPKARIHVMRQPYFQAMSSKGMRNNEM
ncbi:hypothetical protein ACFE04_012088 [Oxalis oulophora]